MAGNSPINPMKWWADGHPVGVVLHHSGVMGDTIRSTIKYHMDPPPGGRGWKNTYNHIVDRDGASYESGEDHNPYNGTDYSNKHYLSVCALGDFNTIKMGDHQKTALLTVLREIKQRYPHITPAVVFRHEDVNPAKKGLCPGKFYPVAECRAVFA